MAKISSDGLVTYKQVWNEFKPDQAWQGNASQQQVANALGRVIAYCVDNQIPIVTTLVVRSDTRTHTDQAISHIYNEASSLGVDVGVDAQSFVNDQQHKARSLKESWTD